ncbi:neutral zinc metallopeptidase [Streptosporangium longisporum]
MRIRMIIAMAGAAAMLLTGTAHAYPIKDSTLTENSLYGSGRLADSTCTEPPIKDGSRAQAKRYIWAVVGCLDTAWEGHLTAAGISFGKPKVVFFDKLPKKYCGHTLETEPGSYAMYCLQARTIMIRLGRDWLEGTDDLWMLHATAALYGSHVMGLTGIVTAYDKAPYRNKSELHEQNRRYSLQSDCLGAVFVRSVQDSIGRGSRDWKKLTSVLKVSGDQKGEERTFGKGSTRVAWSARGHAAADPGACNTWSAASSKVS